ncbi:MAG TPA: DUF4976 domain-containing protein, partial [Saprospiraceae bacterium]|nr:DUF4976 domain-containing protein [Saprospiraceae bacterium]
ALEIANVKIPNTIQGQSLLPMINGTKKEIRRNAFVEYYSNENPFPWTANLDYRVLVTDRYKYIKWLRFEEAELYDLLKDPYEQKNLVNDPSMKKVLKSLKFEMKEQQLKALGID